jgi:integrase
MSGVDRFYAHLIRHTFACRCLERGGSLAALQIVLGHSSIVTTERYAKLTDEVVLRESARLNQVQTVAGTIADESSAEPIGSAILRSRNA